jgi:hypothetical protein
MNTITRDHLNIARYAASVVFPTILERHGLTSAFRSWEIINTNGQIWLAGDVDVMADGVGSIRKYASENVLHDISTALHGRPTVYSNHQGMALGVLLSDLPEFPIRVDLPGVRNGQVRVGVTRDGNEVAFSWRSAPHWLIAGVTGSGKSVLLQSIAYQTMYHGQQLMVADMDGATLHFLEGHPALLRPVAVDPDDGVDLVQDALDILNERIAELHHDFPDPLDRPASIEARNAVVENPWPRIVVILEEFNALVDSLRGGDRQVLLDNVGQLARRGRKFGIHLVVAAQQFRLSDIGTMRRQMNVLCLRVNDRHTARAMGIEDAATLPEHPGRAIWRTPSHQKNVHIQVYYLDVEGVFKPFIRQAQRDLTPTAHRPEQRLTRGEYIAAKWAVECNGGKLIGADLKDRLRSVAGVQSNSHADAWLNGWEEKGWLARDASQGNARFVTDELVNLVIEYDALYQSAWEKALSQLVD